MASAGNSSIPSVAIPPAFAVLDLCKVYLHIFQEYFVERFGIHWPMTMFFNNFGAHSHDMTLVVPDPMKFIGLASLGTGNHEDIKDVLDALANEWSVQIRPNQIVYALRAVLLGFAGGNYYGMQYNTSVATIENVLLKAMAKNEWILEKHFEQPQLFEYQRGSRTDRGVWAARQNVSALFPVDVSIEALNKDLPSDIRVFGMKRVTPKFDARHNCTARTYSYTLPTIAFSHYNDQTAMKDYRVPADRLQRANNIFALFTGQTNFHNYTTDKLFFDRSSERFIYWMECSEPFIECDVEFSRVTVKGSSFMLHQIRKMMGFSLAVIRDVVSEDMMLRSLTKEKFNIPTAPGLGLMLERLHFDEYASRFQNHDPLMFEECDEDVETFRRERIHPFIVETEIKEQSMLDWLEYLMVHSFGVSSRTDEEDRRYKLDPEFDDEWGENPDFLHKLKKRLDQ